MREISDNKTVTASEKRKKSFFYAVAEGEKDIGRLSEMLGVSRPTVLRYARELENAGIARFAVSNEKENKKEVGIALSVCLSFFVVKIGARTVELSKVAFSPKCSYSVVLPYNEALTDEENALCVKSNLEKLRERELSDITLVGATLDDGACIDERVCGEIFGEELSVIERRTSVSSVVDSLALKAIRNARNKK